jgi:hypothetical protein
MGVIGWFPKLSCSTTGQKVKNDDQKWYYVESSELIQEILQRKHVLTICYLWTYD